MPHAKRIQLKKEGDLVQRNITILQGLVGCPQIGHTPQLGEGLGTIQLLSLSALSHGPAAMEPCQGCQGVVPPGPSTETSNKGHRH